jgi:uncharacterized membrane protein
MIDLGEGRENNSEISFYSNYIFYFSYTFSLLLLAYNRNTSLFIALDMTLKIRNKKQNSKQHPFS